MNMPLTNRRVRNSGMGSEAVAALSTSNYLHRVTDDRVIVEGAFSGGTAQAKLDLGPYTYEHLQISVVNTSAISGKTFEANGRHYVQTQHLGDFLKKVTLILDGQRERVRTIAEVIAINAYRGLDTTDGVIYETFGGPNLFIDPMQADAYMLGTNNLREARVEFELTDAWDNATMSFEITASWVPVARNIGWLETWDSRTFQVSAAGEFNITELPTFADISGLYIFGDGINGAELIIDDQVMASANALHLQAAHAVEGGDVSALGAHVAWDFWRGKEAQKGLAGLRSDAERKRNANIRVALDMAGSGEVKVLTGYCGRYVQQR